MLAVAYTDGSYKEFPVIGGVYSGAAVLMNDVTESSVLLSKADNLPEYLPYRNIAGEITAVMMVCQHCLTNYKMKQGDTLEIYHDYVGLDFWVRPKGSEGHWAAKTPLSQMYRDYMNNNVKTIINVRFKHVKSHSNDVVNDVVDEAAKRAIADYVAARQKMEENSNG